VQLLDVLLRQVSSMPGGLAALLYIQRVELHTVLQLLYNIMTDTRSSITHSFATVLTPS